MNEKIWCTNKIPVYMIYEGKSIIIIQLFFRINVKATETNNNTMNMRLFRRFAIPDK